MEFPGDIQFTVFEDDTTGAQQFSERFFVAGDITEFGAMLRAWRGFDDFEARASIKNWLYRIATNVSLNILAARSRRGRMMPDQMEGPATSRPQGRPDSGTPR